MNRAQRKKAQKLDRLKKKQQPPPPVATPALDTAGLIAEMQALQDAGSGTFGMGGDGEEGDDVLVEETPPEPALVATMLGGPFEVLEIADTDLPPATDPEPDVETDEATSQLLDGQRLHLLKRKLAAAQDLVWRGGSARDRAALLARQEHVLIWESGTAADFDAIVRGLPRPLTVFLADGVTMPATTLSLAGVSIFGGS